jgi:hypothetical protein
MGYFFESTPIVNVIKVTIRVNKKTLQLLEEF